jgi:hypothetical protein
LVQLSFNSSIFTLLCILFFHSLLLYFLLLIYEKLKNTALYAGANLTNIWRDHDSLYALHIYFFSMCFKKLWKFWTKQLCVLRNK